MVKKLDAPLPSPRGSYERVTPLIKPQERSQSMGVVAMDTIRGLGPLEECDTDLESQVNNCSDTHTRTHTYIHTYGHVSPDCCGIVGDASFLFVYM